MRVFDECVFVPMGERHARQDLVYYCIDRARPHEKFFKYNSREACEKFFKYNSRAKNFLVYTLKFRFPPQPRGSEGGGELRHFSRPKENLVHVYVCAYIVGRHHGWCTTSLSALSDESKNFFLVEVQILSRC